MDVFGTITSTIDLINKIVSYLQVVRSAEVDCLKLLSGVSALSSLLELLRHRLDSTSADSWNDDVSRAVKASIKGSLDQCHQALESIVLRLSTTLMFGTRSLWWPLKRTQKLKWPFRREEINVALVKIEHLKSLISLAFQTSLMDREFIDKTRGELTVVGLNVEEIKATVSTLEAGHRGQELQDILKWLSPHDFEERHIIIFAKHTFGTGAWFLDHPKFLAWRQGKHNILWCPGNPGVGKSVMSSLIVHQLREEISEGVALVFIYFEYATKYTTAQLIEAILMQLVRRRITSSCMEALRKHRAGNRPTFSELLAILAAEVKTYTRVFVVLDALDEVDSQIWVPFLKNLRALPGVSVLATSCDLGDIAAEFRGDRRLDVMANEEDMKKYIEGRLSRSAGTLRRLLEADASLHEEIMTEVMKKADGMFLLARLHMDSVETASRLKDLRRTLPEFPSDLETTYDKAMARIGNRNRELAYRIFSWLIHAVQPMTISDLQYALAVEDGMTSLETHDLHDEAFITSVCVGLVILRQDGEGLSGVDDRCGGAQIVGFVHYTTQEYFLRNYEVFARLPHPSHLAMTCLRYLLFDIFNTSEPLNELMAIPFVDYVVNSWSEHAQKNSDAAVHKLLMKLLRDRLKVETLGFIFCSARNVSAVQLCAHLGLGDYLKCLLDDGFDLNLKDSDGDTAVTEAAILGQEEIMQLLLGREGVNVNPKGRNGATPLTQAVIHGHQGIVKLLLARNGTDLNWCDDDGKTPIVHAIERGHTEIVKLLLGRDFDVDVNSQDLFAETPLALAIRGGHEEIVQLLLTRDDLDIKLEDGCGDTHLTIAAGVGNGRIVALLLGKGAIDINSKNLAGEVALCDAARWGHEAVVKLLLAQDGIDVNSVAWNGSTPLDCAKTGKCQGVVELISEAGGRTGMELRIEASSPAEGS